VIVLEGDELFAELRDAPVHEAPDPFHRVGAIWEADRPGSFEVAASADGATWTPWTQVVVQHVEVEDGLAGFVGQLEFSEPMSFYRLRAADGAAAYLRLELLPSTMSESVEDGDGTGVSYSAPIGDADVHTRSEWGARSTRCSTQLGSAWRMAIHHTETPTNDSVSPEARLRNIQSYHMDVRGWCDIGYHYLMSRDGRLWEGRPGHLLGAHAGAGNNSGNIGISVMGSHDSTPITDTQIDSLVRLIVGLADRHGIAVDRSKIKGHREYKSTSCPGDALYAQLDEIVGLAADGVPEDEPPPPPPPPSDTVTVLGVLYVGSDTSDRIVGATVTLGTQSVTTNSVGLWRFDGVPVGEYTVTGSATVYQTRSITRATYADESWSSFGLSPADAPSSGTAVLQGVVYYTSDSSNRIAGASISLSTGHTATADANGFYRLTGMPAGPVTITASAPGWTTNSVSRTLVDGETEWGSVQLAPDGGGGGGGDPISLPGDEASSWSCTGTTGTSYPADGSLYVTSFGCWTDSGGIAHGDGDDNCIPWCMSGASLHGTEAEYDALCGGMSGPECERSVNWYTADADRYGCMTRLRVTNPANGKSAVLVVLDRGPACFVEDSVDHWVLDMSYPASYYLFGEPKSASERGEVIVEAVPYDTPIGPES